MVLSMIRAVKRIPRQFLPSTSTVLFHPRLFSTTPSVQARRAVRRRVEDAITADEAEELLDDDYEDDDTTSAGHMMLREHRQTLYYMRVIEHEMPKLVAFRRPFKMPSPEEPVIVRSVDYAGEKHPLTAKRAIVVSVDKLPLRDKAAIHKIKLLAGPRWSEKPPADAGVSGLQNWGNGFIKISCEDFPKPAMNLKWASDTLDKLIAEANNLNSDRFKDVPLDRRHLYSKAHRAKKGEHLRGRLNSRASMYDFPSAWLPPQEEIRPKRETSM